MDLKSIIGRCTVCGTETTKTCSRCKTVFYCGAEHQKADWKRHSKTACFPCVEEVNETLGRHLVVTRDIAAGDKIFAEGPMITSPFSPCQCGDPSTSYKGHLLCLGCCKYVGERKEGQFTCRKCGWTLCSPNCEEAKNHFEFECDIFAQNNIRPPDNGFLLGGIDLLVLRVLLLKVKVKQPEKWAKICKLKGISIPSLIDISMKELAGTLKFLRDGCHLSQKEFPDDLIIKIYGIVMHNSVGRCECKFTGIGGISQWGIYEKSRFIAHSCVGNTITIRNEEKNEEALFATQNIPSGTVLTKRFDYETIMWMGIVERRAHLNKKFDFWCNCEKCKEPYDELGTYCSAMKCSAVVKNKGKKCQGYLLPRKNERSKNDPPGKTEDNWQCNTCGGMKSYSKCLSKIYNKEEQDIDHLVQHGDLAALVAMHEDPGTSVLHPNHCLLMKLQYHIINKIVERVLLGVYYSQTELTWLLKKLESLATKSLKVVEVLCPGHMAERAHLLIFIWISLNTIVPEHSEDPNSAYQKCLVAHQLAKEGAAILKKMQYDLHYVIDELVESLLNK